VAHTFAASQTTIQSIKTWLASNGVIKERVLLSSGRNWLRMNISIAEAESLLKAKYNVFGHNETGKRSVACDEYSIPADLREHIDYITPTIQTSLMLKKAEVSRGLNNNIRPVWTNTTWIDLPSHPRLKLQHEIAAAAADPVAATPWARDLSICASTVTPACIRKLYNMPNGTLDL
jgi:tripeptidyl-peptidase-1